MKATRSQKVAVLALGFFVGWGMGSIADIASSAPCAKHTGSAKSKCIKQRDQVKWPKNPTEAEIIKRVGRANWDKALRIAQCETGGNLRHYPHGRFIGMMGMARSTYDYGRRATGYPWPDTASRAEQVAVAVASHPITLGWSGWGCSHA